MYNTHTRYTSYIARALTIYTEQSVSYFIFFCYFITTYRGIVNGTKTAYNTPLFRIYFLYIHTDRKIVSLTKRMK